LGLLEVIIIPGPNIQAPVFTKDSYEISVDEGSPVNSLVYTFQVTLGLFKPPCNNPINYNNFSHPNRQEIKKMIV
jgi:hypothetical protein